MYQDGVGRAGLLVCHPCGADGRFDVVGVFNVPREKLLGVCVCLHENVLVLSEGKARLEPRFESWARIHYKLVVESAQRVADRLLNGPELSVRTCRNWM